MGRYNFFNSEEFWEHSFFAAIFPHTGMSYQQRLDALKKIDHDSCVETFVETNTEAVIGNIQNADLKKKAREFFKPDVKVYGRRRLASKSHRDLKQRLEKLLQEPSR